MNKAKTVIIIAGPTAVGKTRLAIDVAKKWGTEIISADSRQCYRELRIGVARPSAAELAEVPHHFIASHSVEENVTAALFEAYALERVHGLLKKLDVAVVAGGTGLYLKAFCEGLDAMPNVPDAIHQQVAADYKAHGLAWLQHEVQKWDPVFYAQGETANPARLLRALEVVRATGQSIQSFKKGAKAVRDFNIIRIALQLPKEQLHRNIDARVDAMLEKGLVDEVKGLVPHRHRSALQTVGYKEIFSYLDGSTDLDAAMELVKQATRRYAKRQLTWFRADAAYHWMPPDADAVLSFIDAALHGDLKKFSG